jgi:hypothetical protein
MPIFISESGGGGNFDKKVLEAGAYAGVCDMVVDLGVQASPGGLYAPKRSVLLRFQIPSERVEITKDGETKDLPAVISRTLGLSLNEKATLRQLLQSWRGRAFTPEELKKFDLVNVLGKPAFVNVTHSVKGDRTYANLTSLMPLPKGMPAPVLEGEALWYSIDEPDPAVFDRLPAWVQDKIAGRVIDQPAQKSAVAPAKVWPAAGPAGSTKPKVNEPVDTSFEPDSLEGVTF